jgi:hypothetical protein
LEEFFYPVLAGFGEVAGDGFGGSGAGLRGKHVAQHADLIRDGGRPGLVFSLQSSVFSLFISVFGLQSLFRRLIAEGDDGLGGGLVLEVGAEPADLALGFLCRAFGV